MSRRLNIERRRKRIRHYTARRRRRSPVHRAFLFWWGTVLLLLATAAVLALLLTLRHAARPAAAPAERWQLPPSSLQLIYASEEEVAEALRMGNARRSARAMSDADIGISFEMTLPEPARLVLKPFPPLTRERSALPEDRVAAANLPPMAAAGQTGEAAAPALRCTPALRAVNYAPQVRAQPDAASRGSAVFAVSLDASGRVQHVLRLSPAGEETAWLRTVRLALLRSSGTAAASGHVTIIWNTKDLP